MLNEYHLFTLKFNADIKHYLQTIIQSRLRAKVNQQFETSLTEVVTQYARDQVKVHVRVCQTINRCLQLCT